MLRSQSPSGMCTKFRIVAASNNRDHARNLSLRTLVVTFNRSHVNIGRATTSQSLLLLLARATYIMVLFFTNIRFVVNQIINATPPERLQQHPSFLQRTTPIACSLCEGWTRHDLHILVTAPFCCDRKSRAACAQSFALWQQATIEIMLAISLCVR